MALAKLIESRTYTKVENLDKTSSLNKHFLCDYCGRKELEKKVLILHIQSCVENRTCSWCKIVFRNRGSLVNHCSRMHGENLWQKDKSSTTCNCTVCPKSYRQVTNLKYHIRKTHFNLTTKIFCRENMKVNDVWLERVMNSDAVIEIRKTGENRYLMRRVTNDTTRKITEVKESVDLTFVYPTSVRNHRLWCYICKRTYYKKDFEKHLNERHRNLRQHTCNNCNKSFPRPYQYLRHNCTRLPSRRTFVKKVDCVIIDD